MHDNSSGPLGLLPNEVITSIAINYLDDEALSSVYLVNKFWKSTFSDEYIWRKEIKKKFNIDFNIETEQGKKIAAFTNSQNANKKTYFNLCRIDYLFREKMWYFSDRNLLRDRELIPALIGLCMDVPSEGLMKLLFHSKDWQTWLKLCLFLNCKNVINSYINHFLSEMRVNLNSNPTIVSDENEKSLLEPPSHVAVPATDYSKLTQFFILLANGALPRNTFRLMQDKEAWQLIIALCTRENSSAFKQALLQSNEIEILFKLSLRLGCDEIVTYLIDNYFSIKFPDIFTLNVIARWGSTAHFEYFLNRCQAFAIKPNTATLINAAKAGNVELFKHLIEENKELIPEKGCWMPKSEFNEIDKFSKQIILSGNLELIQWLMQNRKAHPDFVPELILYAINTGKVAVINTILSSYSEKDNYIVSLRSDDSFKTKHTMKSLVEKNVQTNKLSMIDWLLEYYYSDNGVSLLKISASLGNFFIFKYILSDERNLNSTSLRNRLNARDVQGIFFEGSKLSNLQFLHEILSEMSCYYFSSFAVFKEKYPIPLTLRVWLTHLLKKVFESISEKLSRKLYLYLSGEKAIVLTLFKDANYLKCLPEIGKMSLDENLIENITSLCKIKNLQFCESYVRNACKYALEVEDQELFDYLRTIYSITPTIKMLKVTVTTGNLELVKYLVSCLDKKIYLKVFDEILEFAVGSLEIMRFLIEKFHLRPTPKTLLAAASKGSLEVNLFLINKCRIRSTEEIYKAAVASGKLDLVKLYISTAELKKTSYLLSIAIEHGYFTIAKFLMEKFDKIEVDEKLIDMVVRTGNLTLIKLLFEPNNERFSLTITKNTFFNIGVLETIEQSTLFARKITFYNIISYFLIWFPEDQFLQKFIDNKLMKFSRLNSIRESNQSIQKGIEELKKGLIDIRYWQEAYKCSPLHFSAFIEFLNNNKKHHGLSEEIRVQFLCTDYINDPHLLLSHSSEQKNTFFDFKKAFFQSSDTQRFFSDVEESSGDTKEKEIIQDSKQPHQKTTYPALN